MISTYHVNVIPIITVITAVVTNDAILFVVPFT